MSPSVFPNDTVSSSFGQCWSRTLNDFVPCSARARARYFSCVARFVVPPGFGPFHGHDDVRVHEPNDPNMVDIDVIWLAVAPSASMRMWMRAYQSPSVWPSGVPPDSFMRSTISMR